MKVGLLIFAALIAIASCSGHPKRPAGPAPEYERPQVMAWDSGAPVDPLDNVKGEEVTDDEPPAPAPNKVTDAGAGDAG